METSTSLTENTNKQDGSDATPFFISRDGTWFYHGSAILRKSLVKLFASVLKREEDGTFWLETPSERVAVSVVDAPFVIVEANQLGISPNQNLEIRTNTDENIIVDLEHPIYVKTALTRSRLRKIPPSDQRVSSRKSNSTNMDPKKPHSSEKTAKMKSV